jgi:hypothetical protein
MEININAQTTDVAMLIALTTLGRRYGDYELSNWCKTVRAKLVDQLGKTEITIDDDHEKFNEQKDASED